MTSKLHTPNPLLATLLAVFAGMPAALAVAPVDPPALYREGEVLVRYRAGVSDAQMQALHGRLGLLAKRSIARGRTELLQLPGVTTTAAALALLRADPAVEVAEPNVLRFPRVACTDNAALFCPNDLLFAEQWGLRSIGQANYAAPTDPALSSIPGADMDMLLAWDPGADGIFERVGNNTVTIAIVDDSFVVGHADLSANFVAGYDFENDDNNVGPDSGNDGHGTLVAGAAGAIGNNTAGVAGTAWNARLMPLKFGFDSADHIAALAFARDYKIANPGQRVIINASFGGPLFSQLEEDAVNDLAGNNILYVASAGNDDSNTDIARLNYPANLAAPNIVSVAATNRQDALASFSQYGAITTDVAAPGLQIVSTLSPSGYATANNCPNTGACGVSGTSFSSPYTAGVAALILSEFPSATVAEVKARLIEGAEDGDEVNLRTAGGRVNAAQSLNLAARPSLVITGLDWLDANEALDPAESTSVDITIENLWQNATGVSGTLTADNGVTVTSGAVNFGTIAQGGTATATFNMNVGAGINDHRYVHFTLALSANAGAYTATRGFIGEIGRLQTDVLVTQTFAARAVDLYDEFHAWHYDFNGTLPAGHTQLVIETTSTAAGLNSPDIDLLVKPGAPPDYSITVGINPENTPGFFCTSGTTANCQDPQTLIDADADGDEQVVITNPVAGTYHVVIVNFAQLTNGMTYTLRAYTRAQPAFSGDGGRVPAPVLAVLLFAALARRSLRRA